MTSGALSTFFHSLEVELLESNRYSPASLADADVRRTFYYRRNRREFEMLAGRYSGALAVPRTGGTAGIPAPKQQSPDIAFLPHLEIRNLGGILG